MNNRMWSAIMAVLAVMVSRAAVAEEFFFKDGDRVVMIGDSITAQHLYSTYVEMWALTRFPARDITFVNVGIGGDVAPGGNKRFNRDVLPHRPTALTVDFGMNDGGYAGFITNRFLNYKAGLQGIADKARTNSIRVAWITPSPYEKKETGPAIQGYNETLERFSEGVRDLALADKNLFIDQFHPYLGIIDKARAANPVNRIGGGDAIHPGPPGQALMAATILKGMHFPTLVAAIEIDGAAGRMTTVQNCSVEGLRKGDDGSLSFTQTDAALPYFPDEAATILRWSPIRDELNEYRMKITGLADGDYAISLGDNHTNVARFSAAQLAQGVDLGAAVLTNGPIAEQVRAVERAVKAKNAYFKTNIFTGVILAQVNIPDFMEIKTVDIEAKRAAAFTNRMARMPEYFTAIRKTLVMRPHLVRITPIAGDMKITKPVDENMVPK